PSARLPRAAETAARYPRRLSALQRLTCSRRTATVSREPRTHLRIAGRDDPAWRPQRGRGARWRLFPCLFPFPAAVRPLPAGGENLGNRCASTRQSGCPTRVFRHIVVMNGGPLPTMLNTADRTSRDGRIVLAVGLVMLVAVAAVEPSRFLWKLKMA